MDLIKNYLQQTQKPDGLLGSLMISSMNRHHAKLADWGMSHLVNISPDYSDKPLETYHHQANTFCLSFLLFFISDRQIRLYTIQCSAFSAPANLSNASSASQSSVSRSMLFSKQ